MNDLLVPAAIVAVPAMALFAFLGSRWPALAVCLVPLSFPIEQLGLSGVPVGVVQLAGLASVALMAWHQRAWRKPYIVTSPLLFAVALVVFSALVSTVVAVDPVAALRLDAGYLLGLALAAGVALTCSQRRSLRLVIGCVCLVGVVLCAAGIASVGQLRAHAGAGVVDNRATGFFGQPNEMGTFAALMVVLSLGLVFSSRGLGRVLPGLSVLVAVGALVVSLSRGSWLGLGLGLIVFAVLAPRSRRLIAGSVLTVLGVGLVAFTVLPSSPLLSIVVDRAASLVDGRRGPYDQRPAIWREALRQISLRPILGSGPGGYPVLALHSPSRVTTVAPNHAHDLALTLMAEQGLFGVLALAAAIVVSVFAVLRTLRWHEVWPGIRRNGAERALLAAIVAALVVMFGEGAWDYPLRNPVLAMLVWLLVGLLAAAVAGRDPRVSSTRPVAWVDPPARKPRVIRAIGRARVPL